jgi:hypothetical protein
MKTNMHFLTLLAALLILIPSLSPAQELTDEQLQKIIQNPLAYLNFFPIANYTGFDIDYGYGNEKRVSNEMDFQLVIPFKVGKHVNLITRTVFPMFTIPTEIDESVTGLGDITIDMFFTPANPGKFMWGLGPVFTFPAATIDPVRTKKWTLGPAVCFLTQPKGWTLGTFATNSWSFAGDENYPDINFFYWQVFIVKDLPDLWYISTNPKFTSDWKAEKGNRWTVPLGFDFGRLFTFGGLPVNIQAGYYYNIERPQYRPKWTLNAEVSFILPKLTQKELW